MMNGALIILQEEFMTLYCLCYGIVYVTAFSMLRHCLCHGIFYVTVLSMFQNCLCYGIVYVTAPKRFFRSEVPLQLFCPLSTHSLIDLVTYARGY